MNRLRFLLLLVSGCAGVRIGDHSAAPGPGLHALMQAHSSGLIGCSPEKTQIGDVVTADGVPATWGAFCGQRTFSCVGGHHVTCTENPKPAYLSIKEMRAQSSGLIGCSPEAIRVRDLDAEKGEATPTWSAECNGKRFICVGGHSLGCTEEQR